MCCGALGCGSIRPLGRNLMSYFRLLYLFLRVGFMNEVQYRVNFFVQLLESAIALATGLIVLALVFSYTNSLNGWSQAELLVVMGVHIFIGGVIKMIVQPNMVRLMDDIVEGTLDYMLTKPEDAQLLVSVREFRFWQIVDVVVGLVVIGWGLIDLRGAITVANSATFLVTLLFGSLILYSFWLMIASLAFWFTRIHDIVTIFETMYQAGRWPIGVYPSWLRLILTFLIPVAFAVTIPAEAMTARLTLTTLLGAAALAVGLFVVGRLIWRWGLSNYAGASA